MAKRKKLARATSSTISKARNMIIARAFVAGVVIACLLGVFGSTEMLAPYKGTLTSILVLAGLVVGFFNISKKETNNFLLATVSLVIVSGFGGTVLGKIDLVGPYLLGTFDALMAFIIPAVVVAALKAVIAIAKD